MRRAGWFRNRPFRKTCGACGIRRLRMLSSGPVDVVLLDNGLKPSTRRLGVAPARLTQTEVFFQDENVYSPPRPLPHPKMYLEMR